MSSPFLENLFSRAIDLASCVAVIVMPFTIVIIIRHTPRRMRHYSLFLLNMTAWNLAGNVVFSIFHPFPMMPLTCFKFVGFLQQSYHFNHETLGHQLMFVILLIAVNAACGIFVSFQFRYTSVAQFEWIRHINPMWGYAYCVFLHIFSSLLTIFIYRIFQISIVEYGITDPSVDVTNLFCFYPSGFNKSFPIASFFVFFVIVLTAVVTFFTLCFSKLQSAKIVLNTKTVRLQRSLLRNLVVLTSIPFFLAGIPFLIVIATVYFNEFPYSRLFCVLAFIPIINHGAIMCIATLAMFKNYREVVCGMTKRIFRKKSTT
ncbi:hypothetical protein QR680_007208 [Steinernema hermaphroditum]|uniref:Uncharacterized protein n=1 Tax=Steinernema hermaphroditum TaxID=289476 RepID=A0AA39LYR2_9BILA|nr:hypothetical protein QR680_007208 [Steinernema hermaphroditum]